MTMVRIRSDLTRLPGGLTVVRARLSAIRIEVAPRFSHDSGFVIPEPESGQNRLNSRIQAGYSRVWAVESEYTKKPKNRSISARMAGIRRLTMVLSLNSGFDHGFGVLTTAFREADSRRWVFLRLR